MKIAKYIWLLFVIVLYTVNYFWLKIKIWPFTGIVLLLLIVLIVVINIVVKIKNRKGKDDDNFIFSPETANVIKAIDISTQYEASILSMFCLVVGLLLFMIYAIFIAPYTILMKVFVAFNSLCGIALMASMLVTNYQQFMAHKESKAMLETLSNQFGTEILSPDKMKSGSILTPFKELNEEILSKPISEINVRRDDK
jgi:hypothetical protein